MMTDYYRSIDERPVFPSLTAAAITGTLQVPIDWPPMARMPEQLSRTGKGACSRTSRRRLTAPLRLRERFGHHDRRARGGTRGERQHQCRRLEARSRRHRNRALSLRWLAELFGYPADCGGLFVSGGTMANFSAVLTALRNCAEFDTTRKVCRARRATVGSSLHVGSRRTLFGDCASPTC